MPVLKKLFFIFISYNFQTQFLTIEVLFTYHSITKFHLFQKEGAT